MTLCLIISSAGSVSAITLFHSSDAWSLFINYRFSNKNCDIGIQQPLTFLLSCLGVWTLTYLSLRFDLYATACQPCAEVCSCPDGFPLSWNLYVVEVVGLFDLCQVLLLCHHLLTVLQIDLCRAWVGKLFRQKATFFTRKPLKAAVKVSLPQRVLYVVVWLWTTVIK